MPCSRPVSSASSGLIVRELARDRVAGRGDVGAVLPQRLEMRLEFLQRMREADLCHREGDRGAPHHVVAHAIDRRAQVRELLAGAVERRGVRHLEQACGERGFGSYDPHDLIDRRLLIGEHAAHPYRDVRKRRQLDLAGRELRGEILHELERDGVGIGRLARRAWNALQTLQPSLTLEPAAGGRRYRPVVGAGTRVLKVWT